MFEVIEYFTDLKDRNHAYRVGETYPREGYEPTTERIQELASDTNARRRPVIKAVEIAEPVKEELPTIEEEAIEEEKPKKRRNKTK